VERLTTLIIDVNAYLGHFAFRRLRNNTAGSLLKLMDSRGIDRAVVSSASAITYRNAQSGNEEVDGEVKAYRDRLVPFAVINPTYAGWEDDLKTCHEHFGMRGLRLYPGWHNYRLSAHRCLGLVREAAARGMVVSIPMRVEDHRQRSWLVDVPDVPLDDVAALVRACPEARFLLLNGNGYVRSPLGRKDGALPANYRIEVSRLTALLDDELGALLKALGPDRVVFGTGMPFSYPDAALLKLEVLAATPAEKERVLWRNAAEWLPADR
jgi:predicted TIM-barrel fold metal-dependent hydrolase